MPKYSYACRACDHRFDIQQAFSDDALTTCPQCEGPLRKLFGAVGVVFKGSGFYKTDSRSSSSSSSSSAEGSASGKESKEAKGSKEPAPAGASSSSSTAGSGSSSSSTGGSAATS